MGAIQCSLEVVGLFHYGVEHEGRLARTCRPGGLWTLLLLNAHIGPVQRQPAPDGLLKRVTCGLRGVGDGRLELGHFVHFCPPWNLRLVLSFFLQNLSSLKVDLGLFAAYSVGFLSAPQR